MKIILKNYFKFASIIIFLIILGLSITSEVVYAGSTTFQTNTGACDPAAGSFVTFTASTDRNNYSGASQILVTGSVDLSPFEGNNGCSSPKGTMSAKINGTPATAFFPPNTSGTAGIVAPCTIGDYLVSLSGSVTLDNGTNISGSGSLPISVTSNCPVSSANITVYRGSCPSVTNWTSSNGKTGTDTGSFSFVPDVNGTNVSMNATPPTGYVYSSSTPMAQEVFPSGTYSFTLNCLPITDTLTPIVNFVSDPTTIRCSETATLKWSSTNTTSCGIINGLNPDGSLSTTGNPTSGSVSGIQPGYYIISCQGLGGTKSANLNNDVNTYDRSGNATNCAVPPNTPTVTVSANPSIVTGGGSSTITWTSKNTTSCATDWWSNSAAKNGSVTVNPSSTTSYTKTCTGNDGKKYIGSVNVTVSSNATDATLVLKPATQTITKRGQVTLTWSGTNLASCFGNRPLNWTGTTAPSGSKVVSPIVDTTYFLNCMSNNNTVNPGASAQVNVSGSGGGVFDYSLSNSGNVRVVKGGVPQAGQAGVTATLLSGSSQPISLSVSVIGNPSGVQASASRCFPLNPTCTSTVTFLVNPSAPSGTYNVNVTGTPLNKLTSFKLDIVPSQAIVVTCTASPRTQLIGKPVTWTANVSRGNGIYSSYVWSGTNVPTTPPPSTSSFPITYTTTGQKSATVVVTDSIGNSGSCTPSGTINISVNPNFKEF